VTRDAQPAAPAASDAGHPNASLPRRFAAVAYEGLLIAAIVLVTGFLTMPLVSTGAKATHALEVPSLPARALSACAVFGIAGLYCVWSWTGGRRTLPMKTWRLTLEGRDGRAVDTRTAVIRYLAAWIGPLAALIAYEALKPSALASQALWLVGVNYVWGLVDPDRQFLHDRIAGTRIKSSISGPEGSGA
jgi:uncharacterized RDD family membrane protein YckC